MEGVPGFLSFLGRGGISVIQHGLEALVSIAAQYDTVWAFAVRGKGVVLTGRDELGDSSEISAASVRRG